MKPHRIHELAYLECSDFRELLAIDDPLKREFYAEMCRAERVRSRFDLPALLSLGIADGQFTGLLDVEGLTE
jgi:hypothetical protein